jgi:hypothetical protein
MQALHILLDRLIPNLRTLDKFMTNVRKQVRAHLIANDDEKSWHVVKWIVKIRPAQRFRLKQMQADQRMHKNTHPLTVAYSDLRHAVQCLNNDVDNVFAQIALVGFCVGSRLIETLNVSTFSEVVGSDDTIRVTYVAKTDDFREVVRPVLFLTAAQLLERIRTIRRHVMLSCRRNQTPDRAGLTSIYNQRVNAALKKVLPPFTSHRCREAYANLSWHFQSPTDRMSLTAWIANVLAHKLGHMTSALHYQGIRFTGLDGVGQSLLEQSAPPASTANNETVELPDSNGQTCQFERHTRGNLRGTPAADMLAKRELELASASVAPSTANLQRLGFGWSTIQQHRKRKRDADAAQFVELADARGKRHKVARNPNKRDGQTVQRLQQTIHDLDDYGIPSTKVVLAQLGFSSRTMQQVRIQRRETPTLLQQSSRETPALTTPNGRNSVRPIHATTGTNAPNSQTSASAQQTVAVVSPM